MNPNNHSALLARQFRIPLYPPNQYLIISFLVLKMFSKPNKKHL